MSISGANVLLPMTGAGISAATLVTNGFPISVVLVAAILAVGTNLFLVVKRKHSMKLEKN
ncbi:hypothetical protein ACSMFR_01090 [Listeria aquatica]|uniref:hypothetical protein n=1 Tax=Listeria aquatica TaxID=1494960 RepID=UPI003F6FF8EF